MRRLSALVLATTAAALLASGCAKPGSQLTADPGRPPAPSTSRSAAIDSSAANKPCPTYAQWKDSKAPVTTGGTPMNTPEAEALAQALGAKGRNEFAASYGTLIVDFPAGRVALCVTDPDKGRQLAEAAKKADPRIDLARLDLYRCRYSQRTLDAAIGKLGGPSAPSFGFPLYTMAPVQDSSGIEVTTSKQGAHSAALRARLVAVTGGIPVTVTEGNPLTAL